MAAALFPVHDSFLVFPPSLALPPLTSLWLLRPLAPPYAPLPPTLAADIARKDKYVGDRAGGVVACWLVAGGSVPSGKRLSKPLAIVGDGISRPRFLHRPQQ